MLLWLIEFFLLFLILPTLSVLKIIPFILFFLITFFWCLLVLLFDSTFDRKQLWNQAALRPQLKRIFITYVLSCIIVSLGIFLYDERLLFIYVRKIPLLWISLMILYPFFVYPQELVYRTFFFHRYKRIFPKNLIMIVVSAVVFSYMHIVFQNVVAIILTLVGGILFATTYYKTRSTFAAFFEHTLYGCFVFTVGLHSYFLQLNTRLFLEYIQYTYW